MARLDARWGNFAQRGQAWDHFWQDGPAATGAASYPITLTATVTMAPAMTRSVGVRLSLAQGFIAVWGPKTVNKTLTASPTLVPTLSRPATFLRTLTAVTTLAPALTSQRAFLVTLTATTTMAVSMKRSVGIRLSATPSMVAGLARSVAMTMTAIAPLSAAMSEQLTLHIRLSANPPFVASLTPNGTPPPASPDGDWYNAALIQRRR